MQNSLRVARLNVGIMDSLKAFVPWSFHRMTARNFLQHRRLFRWQVVNSSYVVVWISVIFTMNLATNNSGTVNIENSRHLRNREPELFKLHIIQDTVNICLCHHRHIDYIRWHPNYLCKWISTINYKVSWHGLPVSHTLYITTQGIIWSLTTGCCEKILCDWHSKAMLEFIDEAEKKFILKLTTWTIRPYVDCSNLW